MFNGGDCGGDVWCGVCVCVYEREHTLVFHNDKVRNDQ